MFRQPVTRFLVHIQQYVLVFQLRLQFGEELVDHALDAVMAQTTKLDDGIQTVTEFRREGFLDHFHGIGGVILLSKANRGARHGLSAGIGGQHNDHVAEVRLAPVVIGQRAVVHDLQQQIEDFRVGFLDFIEQQDAVRVLAHCLGQQTALIKTDIARRRADQA